VRAEFGYPIMVTPYSQFVGVQGALNVIIGERYTEITDEVIQYAMGIWGEEESSSMDPMSEIKSLAAPGQGVGQVESAETSIQELRRKARRSGVSDDEFLLRYFAGNDHVDAMKAAGAPKKYPSHDRW